MSSDDPLLRATADGDPACPDGRALAAMGDLVRDAMRPPRPVDLVPGVLARLEGADARHDDAFSDQDIDACYDGDGTASP
ncbi:MAG: hypothetical protein H0W72_15555, partial [Planctomycetes bacterium]|nr:hypothetical protein [Planctomycetota bacterium]